MRNEYVRCLGSLVVCKYQCSGSAGWRRSPRRHHMDARRMFAESQLKTGSTGAHSYCEHAHVHVAWTPIDLSQGRGWYALMYRHPLRVSCYLERVTIMLACAHPLWVSLIDLPADVAPFAWTCHTANTFASACRSDSN